MIKALPQLPSADVILWRWLQNNINNLNVLESVPTTDNLKKGDIALYKNGAVRLYYNVDGTIGFINAGTTSGESGSYAWQDAVDLPSGDTTPDVSGGNVFNIPAAVAITNLDGGTNGQLVELRAGATGISITHDTTKMYLEGGISLNMTTRDRIWFRRYSGVWEECHRILLT